MSDLMLARSAYSGECHRGQGANNNEQLEPRTECTLDSELEAAIEYKIASAGLDGVNEILALVRDAVRRGVYVSVDEAM